MRVMRWGSLRDRRNLMGSTRALACSVVRPRTTAAARPLDSLHDDRLSWWQAHVSGGGAGDCTRGRVRSPPSEETQLPDTLSHILCDLRADFCNPSGI
jgi:hypothetical protein